MTTRKSEYRVDVDWRKMRVNPPLRARDHRNFMPGEFCPECEQETVMGENGARQCYECGFVWENEDEDI